MDEIVNGYVAYTATYDVDFSASTITHHRKSHINAELGQLSVVCFYDFGGDTLTLTVAPERELRLKWLRLKTKIQIPYMAASGRGCVNTPQQFHPRSPIQTQRETLLIGLRACSLLLASN